MALNINGTTGISGVDGSASAPALQGTDSNTGINFASDTVNINTGGVTRASLSSVGKFTIEHATSGNVAAEIHTSGSGLGNQIYLHNDHGLAYVGQAGDTTGDFIVYNGSNSNMVFSTNASERFRIKDTSFRSVGQAGDFTAKGISLEESSVGGRLYIGRTNDDTVAEFHRSNTRVGTISVNSSNTSYNTSSDYRLKENVVAISDGITRLKTLKPSRFNFKIDTDTTVDGFLAHEVTAVPEAITGTKDEVDSDNKPVYQGIDQSKLVPLLTAALQEAVAKIEVLETKVAALEAG
jgi:hypothetical protein